MKLITKWIEVLILLYRKYDYYGKGWINYKHQKIYSKPSFHKIMAIFLSLGWVDCQKTQKGIIIRKYYRLTDTGYNIVHHVFADLFLKCKEIEQNEGK
jgi:hypothetical protein